MDLGKEYIHVGVSVGVPMGVSVGMLGRHVKWVCQVGVSGGCAR